MDFFSLLVGVVRVKELEFFKKHGYVKIASGISRELIDSMRSNLISQHAGERVLQAPEIFEIESLEKILFNEHVVSVLSELYEGNVAIFPSVHCQSNSFTQKIKCNKKRGLHIDASAEVYRSLPHCLGEMPAWVNIGFYFQDSFNGGYGGGISILKRSHVWVRRLAGITSKGGGGVRLVVALLQRFLPDFCISDIPSERGDIIIFDNRLLHCSQVGPLLKRVYGSPRGRGQSHVKEIDKEYQKLAVYWFAGNSQFSADIMENNFRVRVEGGMAANGGFDYAKAVKFSDGDGYPAFIRANAAKAGFGLI